MSIGGMLCQKVVTIFSFFNETGSYIHVKIPQFHHQFYARRPQVNLISFIQCHTVVSLRYVLVPKHYVVRHRDYSSSHHEHKQVLHHLPNDKDGRDGQQCNLAKQLRRLHVGFKPCFVITAISTSQTKTAETLFQPLLAVGNAIYHAAVNQPTRQLSYCVCIQTETQTLCCQLLLIFLSLLCSYSLLTKIALPSSPLK